MTVTDPQDIAALLRAIHALSRRLRAARPQGSLGLSSVSILGSLNRQGPMAAIRLATVERLQPQSLTRLIAGLEKAGLIARTRSPTDRREILIAISDEGRRVLKADLDIRRDWLAAAIANGLDDQERDQLLATAQIMLKLAAVEEPE